jgi:hypothetical protein
VPAPRVAAHVADESQQLVAPGAVLRGKTAASSASGSIVHAATTLQRRELSAASSRCQSRPLPVRRLLLPLADPPCSRQQLALPQAGTATWPTCRQRSGPSTPPHTSPSPLPLPPSLRPAAASAHLWRQRLLNRTLQVIHVAEQPVGGALQLAATRLRRRGRGGMGGAGWLLRHRVVWSISGLELWLIWLA